MRVFGQESKTDVYQTFTPYSVFQLGVDYLDRFYLEPGYDLYLVTPNDNVLDLGISGNLSYAKGEFYFFPEASVGFLFSRKEWAIDPYSKTFRSAFYSVRTYVSPYHVTPEIGITLLDLIELNVGYGFEFRKYKNTDLQGFKAGLSLRIPFLLFWHD